MSVVIETTLGDITIDLYVKQRPRACINFLKLCKMKYYNFNLFHTINRGFIAQTGDPTGSRNGGESIWGVLEGSLKRYFEAETIPRIKHTTAGLVSFVGTDDKMLGSQFFITLAPDLTYLDEQHCVFGEVTEGLDVLDILNEAICDNEHRPYKDIRITHTVILDDPFPDPDKFCAPDRSPDATAERLQGGRIAPDEEIDETEGKTSEEISEIIADREAKARATILEMVGDIPDADIAPPENVLFVCKLNPLTNDDDLEIIFSRFGKIKSCEVIRDKKSGDSLQYAFVEFEEQKSCEDAYFKMDNVLIDDRRIHVDFSQSVAKVKWLGKGRGVRHYDDKGRTRKNESKNDFGNGRYKSYNNKKDRSPSQEQKKYSDGDDDEHYRQSKNKRDYRSRDGREVYEKQTSKYKSKYEKSRDSSEENTGNKTIERIGASQRRSRSRSTQRRNRNDYSEEISKEYLQLKGRDRIRKDMQYNKDNSRGRYKENIGDIERRKRDRSRNNSVEKSFDYEKGRSKNKRGRSKSQSQERACDDNIRGQNRSRERQGISRHYMPEKNKTAYEKSRKNYSEDRNERFETKRASSEEKSKDRVRGGTKSKQRRSRSPSEEEIRNKSKKQELKHKRGVSRGHSEERHQEEYGKYSTKGRKESMDDREERVDNRRGQSSKPQKVNEKSYKDKYKVVTEDRSYASKSWGSSFSSNDRSRYDRDSRENSERKHNQHLDESKRNEKHRYSYNAEDAKGKVSKNRRKCSDSESEKDSKKKRGKNSKGGKIKSKKSKRVSSSSSETDSSCSSSSSSSSSSDTEDDRHKKSSKKSRR